MDSKLGTSYSYSFSFRELVYKLFKRKKCPKCEGKLFEMHQNKFDKIEKNTKPARTHHHYANEHVVYTVDILYKCNDCNSVYTINELSKKEV